jgi:thiol-disulfide isomerase/thioredoxin
MTGIRPRRNGPRVALPSLLLLAAFVLAACSGGTDASTPGQGYVSGEGVIEEITTSQRRELPPITGTLLDGGQYDSREQSGKVVVYNVWGSWCVPCREEAPVLRKVWNETRERGVQFVGINVKDNDAAARAFERRYDITYPSITTADSGGALLAFGPSLPRSAVPSTVVVDRRGRVAARVIGPTTYGTLKSLVEAVLDEGG